MAMAVIEKDRILQLRGEDLYDSAGEKIGSVEEIFLDDQTGAPEWALVSTGLFGGKSTFVPLRNVTESDGTLRVPFDKAKVKDAPKLGGEGHLSPGDEANLYRYYGIEYREPGAGVGSDEEVSRTEDDAAGTVGRDVSGPTTDDAMTRSEEELTIGKTERESGRVRLRKYVVTDEVTETVPVKREEVRVEREPITDANAGDALDGPAISEEEHEVVLHEEEVVAEKRVVPKERIRLDKDVETDERTVSEDVRREEIELDDADRRSDRA
jgi:uncharacterized protein (TIGR02271 family)